MNKLKKRNGRVYCDMCNQSFLDEAACEPFLKDGETVVECIARNRKDTGMVLRLLAQEKLRTEQLRARVAELEAERDGWQQDFNTMQAEMIRQTDAAIARRFDDARREEALCELLGRAQTEIDLTLGFFGGCDHDVGVCCCGTQRLLDEIDAALAGKQPQEGE